MFFWHYNYSIIITLRGYDTNIYFGIMCLENLRAQFKVYMSHSPHASLEAL
jgi:hypothetical protein